MPCLLPHKPAPTFRDAVRGQTADPEHQARRHRDTDISFMRSAQPMGRSVVLLAAHRHACRAYAGSNVLCRP
jgi:hypothetical protein